MSRFNNFVDFLPQRHDDFAETLADNGVTGNLYRRAIPNSGNIGFNVEVGGYEFVKRVEMLFNIQSSRKATNSEIGSIMKNEYVCLTKDRDIRIDDRIEVNERPYIVREVDTSDTAVTRFVLNSDK